MKVLTANWQALAVIAAINLVIASLTGARAETTIADEIDAFAKIGLYASVCTENEISAIGWRTLTGLAKTYPQAQLKERVAYWRKGIETTGPDLFCETLEKYTKIPQTLREITHTPQRR